MRGFTPHASPFCGIRQRYQGMFSHDTAHITTAEFTLMSHIETFITLSTGPWEMCTKELARVANIKKSNIEYDILGYVTAFCEFRLLRQAHSKKRFIILLQPLEIFFIRFQISTRIISSPFMSCFHVPNDCY